MGIALDERKIAYLERAEEGLYVIFEDSDRAHVGFLFNKPKCDLVSRKLVESLGVEIIDEPAGAVIKKSEPFGETSVKGVLYPEYKPGEW